MNIKNCVLMTSEEHRKEHFKDLSENEQIKILQQKNAKLQSQIDEVKELTSKYDLSNIKCECNCLRNFIGNLEQTLSKLEEVK